MYFSESEEQRLAQEVLYLHSLWHQGPPSNSSPNPYPNPGPDPYPSPYPSPYPNPGPDPYPSPYPGRRWHDPSQSLHLHSCFTTTTSSSSRSQKIKKKTKKEKAKKLPVSGIEWPCEESVADSSPATASGWPALKPFKPSPAPPPSAAEVGRRAAMLAQLSGLEASHQFFARNAGSDGEVSDGDEEDDDDDEDDVVMGGNGGGFEECEEFRFFLKLFSEDGSLKEYYKKHYQCGEFSCLVCGGTQKKVGKRYKDCVALVQHAIGISNTNKRRAHRAFGHVICKVLGWDLKRLPTIMQSLTVSTVDSMPEESGELQGNGECVNVENGEAEGSDVCGREGLAENADASESMDCNIDLGQDGGVKSVENPNEGVGNCLVMVVDIKDGANNDTGGI